MEVRGSNVRIGVAMLAMAATALLQSCADYVIKMGHLKDNPMDQAIATGIASRHQKEIRHRLLQRFPLGHSVSEVQQYLESVGARCRTPNSDR